MPLTHLPDSFVEEHGINTHFFENFTAYSSNVSLGSLLDEEGMLDQEVFAGIATDCENIGSVDLDEGDHVVEVIGIESGSMFHHFYRTDDKVEWIDADPNSDGIEDVDLALFKIYVLK